MIFLDINNNFSKNLISNVNNNDMQVMTAEDRMQLVAKATLDRRLNARDLKLYNYIACYEYLRLTQEEISELLDLSRSNVNKSLEKLASFNYIEKREVKPEGETRKKMIYIAKNLQDTGIIKCNAHDIIRVLNVSNVFDSKLKYTYCSQQDFNNYKLDNKECNGIIDAIEEFYDSENEQSRKKALELIELFSPVKNKDDAIRNLRNRIEYIENKTFDTKNMINKIAKFSRNLTSNVLDATSVQEVLQDENAKLILFLDRTEDVAFENFKNKYLEDYIRFVCAFSDLSENENFFKLYYENKKVEMSLTEIIRMLGYTHREVPHMRQNASDTIMNSFNNFLKVCKKLELSEKAQALVEEISELYDGGIPSDGVYTSREVSLILYVLNSRHCIRDIGLSFDSFVQLYNPELSDMIAELEKINPTLFETILADVKAQGKAEKPKKSDESEEEVKGDKLIELLESHLDDTK